jgi:uncharacterized protein (DUF3084 family)
MPQSREDRIYLAYKACKKQWAKEEVGQLHAHAVVEVGRRFALSPIKVQQIVNARRDANQKK